MKEMKMKKYDYLSAKKFIETHRDKIKSVNMGLAERWKRTAVSIYRDGAFTYDLSSPNEKVHKNPTTDWATPIIEVKFKAGPKIIKYCYVDLEDPKPQDDTWFKLGLLTGVV